MQDASTHYFGVRCMLDTSPLYDMHCCASDTLAALVRVIPCIVPAQLVYM